MNQRILLVIAVVALFVSVPAYSQYIFIDVNGDGVSSYSNPGLPMDLLAPSVTSVDIYFVTDKNRDGSDAICNSAEPFTINQYEFTLRTAGNGAVSYNSWTDNMGFLYGLVQCGDGTFCTGGPDVWIAKGSGAQYAPMPPGKHKIGTLGITVTGMPHLTFATSSTLSQYAQTAFGGDCDGQAFDSLQRLGIDFFDSDGTEPATPVTPTTWGKIKDRYR